ncbi:MAG TPA: hypothetical protein VF669_14050 [Tepidisphaeraceae bacterium]
MPAEPAQPALRYVVLRHEGVDDPHFDLMFEIAPGSRLESWRASDWPVSTKTQLQPIPSHRPAYLDFEGPISGNRGSVTRVAFGRHRILHNEPQRLVVQLDDQIILDLQKAASA